MAVPPTRLNVADLAKICVAFDGGDSNRWMRLVAESLIDLGFDEDIPPRVFIKAIDHLISPTVADNVQLDARVERIFNNSANATPGDVDYVKEVFMKKYPPRSRTNKTDASALLRELSQGADEPLLTYYERALTILHLLDGRDITEATEDRPLTGTDNYALSSVVQAFAKGLHDKTVRAKAIDSGASTSAGLYSAYHLADEATKKLEMGKKIHEEEDIQEIIRLFQLQNKGRSVQQVASYLAQLGTRTGARDQLNPSAPTQNRAV